MSSSRVLNWPYFLFLLFSQSTWAGPSRAILGVHWGSIESNTTMLNQGGAANAHDHWRDLNYNSDNATLNDAVFQQIKAWYESSHRSDVAGAGFYFSRNLFDSRAFGDDLLIVELEDLSGAPVEITSLSRSEIKQLANGHMDAVADVGPLPLVTKYNGTWHVISRTPTQAGESSIRIRFRAPAPEDVPRLYQALRIKTDPYDILQFANDLAEQIQVHSTAQVGSGPTTRSGEIVLHRLLYDYSYPDLMRSLKNTAQAGRNTLSGQSHNFLSLLKNFHRTLPANDPRTTALADAGLERFYRVSHDLKQERDFDEFFEFYELASQGAKVSVASRFREAFHANATAQLSGLIRVFHDIGASLPTSQRRIWEQVIRKTLQIPHLIIEPSPLTLEVLHGMLGAQATEDLVMQSIRGIREGAVSSSSGRPGHPGYNHKIIERLGLAAGYFQKQGPQAAIRFLRQALDMPQNEYAAIRSLTGLLNQIYSDSDASAIAFWTPLIRQVLQEDAFKERAFETKLYEAVYYRRKTTAQLTALYISIGQHVPELADSLIADVKSAAQNLLEELPLASIIAHLNQMRIESPENLRRNLNQRYESFETSQKARISRAEYLRAGSQALRNIAGSRQYSEISRTFTLVDPILVSEDLRTLNATKPYQRFNENFVDQAGTLSQQPTWENFQNAWDELNHGLWLRENLDQVQWNAQEKRPDVERDSEGRWRGQYHYLTGRMNLAKTILQTHGMLLLNNVDGTHGTTLQVGYLHYESQEYNRNKFTTHFTLDQWQQFEGPQNRTEIEKFFEITSTPSGFDLKFKSDLDLAHDFPSLRSFLRTRRFQEGIPQPLSIIFSIQDDAYAIKDPIARAAMILHRVPKMHPFENGNGRLSRLWATMELVHAGLPAPIGLPTNDFLMTEERMRLEVRRSLKLGQYWQEMLTQAASDKVSSDDFFQSKFRGSNLEGLLHINPASTDELKTYVEWLEAQTAPPEFGKDFMVQVEAAIQQMRSAHGSVAQTSEMERAQIIEQVWQKFRKQHAATLDQCVIQTLQAVK